MEEAVTRHVAKVFSAQSDEQVDEFEFTLVKCADDTTIAKFYEGDYLKRIFPVGLYYFKLGAVE
jgi:hypothetical protein